MCREGYVWPTSEVCVLVGNVDNKQADDYEIYLGVVRNGVENEASERESSSGQEDCSPRGSIMASLKIIVCAET